MTIPPMNPPSVVFGLHPVLEALRSGVELDKILLHREAPQITTVELVQLARQAGVEVQKVPLAKLQQITKKNHQGVVAFRSIISYASLDHVVSEAFGRGDVPRILALDHITDVRNMGALARTAACAGMHALVVPSKGSAQINSDAIKSSSGALMHLPVCRVQKFMEAIRYLKESGLHIIAATEKATVSVFDADFSGPVAIVVGSEEDGISDEVIRMADQLVQIPMQGTIGSLNVSVATGVVLFEMVRQNRNR
jgi:23S rRNA (guanosine2251-2'-O)-methyltransferase